MKNTFVRLFTAFATVGAALQLHAATFSTRFDTDPLASGWQIHGTTNLFAWDSTNENLRVTWDSSEPNSYFHHPAGTTLTRAHGFRLAFDITLDEEPVAGGLQLALGLLKLSDATSPNFFRGSGSASPNLAEFDYFPDVGWGPSLSATLVDASNRFDFVYALEPLRPGQTYQIILMHQPGARRLTGQVFTNGQFVTDLPLAFASPDFGDFELDTLAICSYSDENAYGSTILARGTVDNLVLTTPLPVQAITNISATEISLASDAAWNYTLECTTNLANWTQAAPTVPGNGGTLVLQATNAPADHGFYRVRAELP